MVWLNGTWVGASKDGKTSAEFDVTSLLREGDNILAVMVGGCAPVRKCDCWMDGPV